VRILLDEQLPRQLAPYLVGHDVRTVQQESWAGFKNGALLTQAEDAGFSVFVTGDQNLEFQRTKCEAGSAVAQSDQMTETEIMQRKHPEHDHEEPNRHFDRNMGFCTASLGPGSTAR
jgi:hypothetical protein